MSNLSPISDARNKYGALIKRWQGYCAEKDFQNYFTDGPVTEQYWNEPTRIAVVNLEAYGYEDCGHTPVDISVLKHWMTSTGGAYRTKTTRYTSVFINALFRRLAEEKQISAEDIRDSYYRIEDLIAAMERIAYVNIRKLSNPYVAQDIPMIRHELAVHGWYLKEQLDILSPHVIIFGGIEGCNAGNMLFDLNGRLQYEGLYRLNKDCLLVSIRHLSRVRYKTLETVLESMANNLT